MGRRSFAIQEVEQLKQLSRHTLNLCDVCTGCSLQKKIKDMETEAWKAHRQGVQTITYRCNSFTPDSSKRRISPVIGEGNV